MGRTAYDLASVNMKQFLDPSFSTRNRMREAIRSNDSDSLKIFLDEDPGGLDDQDKVSYFPLLISLLISFV